MTMLIRCLVGLLVLVSLATLLWLLDRLLLRAEARGWIYYRKRKSSGGTFTSGVAGAMRELDRLAARPSVEHTIEAERPVILEKENDGN